MTTQLPRSIGRFGRMFAIVAFVVPLLSGQGQATIGQPQSGTPQDGAPAQDDVSPPINGGPDRQLEHNILPTTAAEARTRARILHEAFHGALQVMHRDFFREDQKLKLPSKSLEDVFEEMARSQNIELHWLAVNTEAMSIHHKPRDEFEKAAIVALSSGDSEFENVGENEFKYAGAIRLSASCVKCHVHSRTSNEDRTAALVITLPLAIQQE